MRIEILTTPNKSLKETGFGAIKTCASIFESLRKDSHDIKLTTCKSESDLNDAVIRCPDLVALAVKYIQLDNGKKLWLSEFFEKAGIPYTGSKKETLRFDSDKVAAKELVKLKGIRTADYFITTPARHIGINELPISFPLFLKPTDAANGNGVDDLSLVNDYESFKNKVHLLFEKYNQPVLAEKFLGGREFSVAIIESPQNNDLIISPIEIIPPMNANGVRILGERVKKEDSETLSQIDDVEIKSNVQRMALDAFRCLGARDFGRIDIKMDNEGNCYFMEVNLVPGMTEGSSYFPQACKMASGLTYDAVIELMIARHLSSPTNVGSSCITLWRE